MREYILDPIDDTEASKDLRIDSAPSLDEAPLQYDSGKLPYSREDEGTAGWLKRQAIRSGTQALSSTVGLPGTVSDIFSSLIEAASGYSPSQIVTELGRGHPEAQFTPEEIEYGRYLKEQSPDQARLDEPVMPSLPTSADIFSKIKGFFPEGYLESETAGEKFIDRLSSVAPTLVASIATGGTSLIPGVFKAASVAGAEQAVEEAGGGPIAQLLTGLAAGGLFSAIKYGRKTENVMSAMKKAQGDAYKKIDQAAKNKNIPVTSSLKERVTEFKNKLFGDKTGLKSSNLNEVRKQIGPIANDILEKDVIKADFLTDTTKHLNSLFGENSRSRRSQSLYMQFKKILEDGGLSFLAKQDPKGFGRSFIKGNDITKAIHGVDNATQFVSDLVKIVPVKSGIVRKLFEKGAWLIDEKNSPLMSKFFNVAPGDAMKYLGRIGSSALTGDRVNTVRNIRNLDKVVQHREKSSGRLKGGRGNYILE